MRSLRAGVISSTSWSFQFLAQLWVHRRCLWSNGWPEIFLTSSRSPESVWQHNKRIRLSWWFRKVLRGYSFNRIQFCLWFKATYRISQDPSRKWFNWEEFNKGTMNKGVDKGWWHAQNQQGVVTYPKPSYSRKLLLPFECSRRKDTPQWNLSA